LAVTYVFGPELNPPVNEAEYRRVFASLAEAGLHGIMVADNIEKLCEPR
jgi:hypothetical protein